MARSFVDTDLLDADDREEHGLHVESEDAAARLARQKEHIQEQVADAAEEIERLQMRQKELEQARLALRELHRKQHEYEDGKKDLIEKLNRDALQLRKEGERLTRILELVTVTRTDFEDMLRELREIREDEWTESAFEESLDTSLALLESMRGGYTKARARLAAQGVEGSTQGQKGGDEISAPDAAPHTGGWLFWFRAGIAFAISLGAVGAILLSLFLYLR